MSAEAILSRLEGVRQTRAGRWIARCPAHEDKHPSLSIRELHDGRVLIHDFAGCSVQEVLSGVRLGFEALFPESSVDGVKPERRPWHAVDVLACLAMEALIVAVAASNIAEGLTLSDKDRDRLLLAAKRIRGAVDMAVT